MKKIKSIYIVFIFAAISSYGLWACTGTTTSETISEEKKPTALDSLPVAAEVDSDFYIKVNLKGTEHTFNYLALDKAEGNNIVTSNLFRFKRCEDINCINSFYLQAHNFNLNQATPFTLTENKGASQKIILSFITMTEDAKKVKKIKPEDVDNLKITIEKIEGDIYEGSFGGTVIATPQDSLSGSFRMKMIVNTPAA